MTSLEFIEKEIEKVKHSLKELSITLNTAIEAHWDDFRIEMLEEHLKYLNKRLTHLCLIKSELETLYILHNKLEFSVIEINTEEGAKYHLVMKGYNSLISKEEVESFKKALEMKHEQPML